MSRFEIIDERTVVDVDGARHDVFESVERLPWVDQLCPLMPHQYAHLNRSEALAYHVVEHMLKAANPDTYRAYFRGYRSPNRYWDAPDGQRYWLTRMMINRCRPDSVEPLRLVIGACDVEGLAVLVDGEVPELRIHRLAGTVEGFPQLVVRYLHVR